MAGPKKFVSLIHIFIASLVPFLHAISCNKSNNESLSLVIEKVQNVYLLARHMQFPAKVQKSYAFYLFWDV